MRSDYEQWLRMKGYDPGTITAQLHRVGRVETHLGDLDRHYDDKRLSQVMEALRYSAEDERCGRPNPTQIPINGNLRNNLASYRSAVAFYGRFRESGSAVVSEVAELGQTAARADTRAGSTPAQLLSRARRSSTPVPPPEHARTFAEFGFDGEATLTALIAASRYGTVAQAVASLSVFSHPKTVEQTGCKALYPTIRGTPGQFVEVDGRPLMTDDNRSPFDAFRWANRLGGRWRDSQVNHVYRASGDPDSYTALANIVVTPAFLAKLTDTHAEVRALLAWRAYDLYGWAPDGHSEPARPDGYAALEWAAPLPPVEDVAVKIAASMDRSPKNRTVLAARRLGWLFGPAAA